MEPMTTPAMISAKGPEVPRSGLGVIDGLGRALTGAADIEGLPGLPADGDGVGVGDEVTRQT